MLSNNDVQLFYRLLDSLGSSLKELAVKYELLVRASDGNAKGTADLSKDVAGLERSFDRIEGSLGESKEKISSGFAAVEKAIEKCNNDISEIKEVATRIYSSGEIRSQQISEIVSTIRHLDGHMDGYNEMLGKIDGKVGDASGVAGEMKAVRQELEPVIAMSKVLRGPLEAAKEHLKKPATILLAVYVLFASIIAFSKMTSWIWDRIPEIRKANVSAHSATNAVVNAATNAAVSSNVVARPR